MRDWVQNNLTNYNRDVTFELTYYFAYLIERPQWKMPKWSKQNTIRNMG